MNHVKSIFTASLILLIVSGCEARYESVGEARSAGAFKRGWIPEILPNSATQIRETHVVDTNQTWGSFSYDAEDIRWTLSLVPLAPDEELVINAPDSVSWWNPKLRGRVTPTSLKPAGLEALEYRGAQLHAASGADHVYFFLSRKEARAYFWRPES